MSLPCWGWLKFSQDGDSEGQLFFMAIRQCVKMGEKTQAGTIHEQLVAIRSPSSPNCRSLVGTAPITITNPSIILTPWSCQAHRSPSSLLVWWTLCPPILQQDFLNSTLGLTVIPSTLASFLPPRLPESQQCIFSYAPKTLHFPASRNSLWLGQGAGVCTLVL